MVESLERMLMVRRRGEMCNMAHVLKTDRLIFHGPPLPPLDQIVTVSCLSKVSQFSGGEIGNTMNKVRGASLLVSEFSRLRSSGNFYKASTSPCVYFTWDVYVILSVLVK